MQEDMTTGRAEGASEVGSSFEIIGVIQGDAVELACFDLMVGWLVDVQGQFDGVIDMVEDGYGGA